MQRKLFGRWTENRKCQPATSNQKRETRNEWICHLLLYATLFFSSFFVTCSCFYYAGCLTKLQPESLSNQNAQRAIDVAIVPLARLICKLFAYVPHVQLPGRRSIIGRLCRKPALAVAVGLAACKWHNRNGKRHATRHNCCLQQQITWADLSTTFAYLRNWSVKSAAKLQAAVAGLVASRVIFECLIGRQASDYARNRKLQSVKKHKKKEKHCQLEISCIMQNPVGLPVVYLATRHCGSLANASATAQRQAKDDAQML